MSNTFEQLIRESDKATPVPESIAKYAAALVAGTHEITSLTIRPKRQWVGLTDKERKEIWKGCDPTHAGYVTALVEAKLKEKNT